MLSLILLLSCQSGCMLVLSYSLSLLMNMNIDPGKLTSWLSFSNDIP